MAGAATSPSSTRTRRSASGDPGAAIRSAPQAADPATDPTALEATDEAPEEELIGGADDVELIDVEQVADDATATGTAVVGVLEIDEADEDDEEEAATPAVAKAKPAGKDATPDKPGESEEFTWDDEEESEALKQARKDAELTASADSVRAYLPWG